MFKKILVANRGEIACRIIKTARRMGIETVAIYSEADRNSLHVEMADEAVCVGPPPSSQSYLVTENIIKACKQSGSEAVHPGYGFLSENASFAEALESNGIIFIGPNPKAIISMGDKIRSKQIAKKSGVNTIPGAAGSVKDADEAVKAAEEIGYPVMLKASAGGGGKGIRVAKNETECREGFKRASSEARSSFGDDRLFVEKYIEGPRHIEIQILADSHGNLLYLGERECSIQRRRQKVIEEAPSPFIDPATRKAMGEQAVALARSVDYHSAGTVEFIVDKDRNFYFLEMNTRLQVEHPVTEMVTGFDLVELMIRIASGENIPFGQDDVKINGWAIETRVYAEDPFRNFLPSIGRLSRYMPPEQGQFARVDTGVSEGDEITIHYDPMIAKLITHGSTRDQAIENMRIALDEFYIRGVSHNLGFLAAIMVNPRFIEGRLSTNFIDEQYPDGFHAKDAPHDDPALLIAVVATMHRKYLDRAVTISGQTPGMERKIDDDWSVVIDDKEYAITLTREDGAYVVLIGGKTYKVKSEWLFGHPLFRGEINGTPVCLQVERRNIEYRILHRGCLVDVKIFHPRAAELNRFMLEKKLKDTSRFLLSPMPGLLVNLSFSTGDEVKEGEELAVVEAMKMENTLYAPRDAKIMKIMANVGDNLAVDQVIIEFQ